MSTQTRVLFVKKSDEWKHLYEKEIVTGVISAWTYRLSMPNVLDKLSNMSDMNLIVLETIRRRLDVIDTDWEYDFLSDDGEFFVLFLSSSVLWIISLEIITNAISERENPVDDIAEEDDNDACTLLDWNELGLDFLINEGTNRDPTVSDYLEQLELNQCFTIFIAKFLSIDI